MVSPTCSAASVQSLLHRVQLMGTAPDAVAQQPQVLQSALQRTQASTRHWEHLTFWLVHQQRQKCRKVKGLWCCQGKLLRVTQVLDVCWRVCDHTGRRAEEGWLNVATAEGINRLDENEINVVISQIGSNVATQMHSVHASLSRSVHKQHKRLQHNRTLPEAPEIAQMQGSFEHQTFLICYLCTNDTCAWSHCCAALHCNLLPAAATPMLCRCTRTSRLPRNTSGITQHCTILQTLVSVPKLFTTRTVGATLSQRLRAHASANATLPVRLHNSKLLRRTANMAGRYMASAALRRAHTAHKISPPPSSRSLHSAVALRATCACARVPHRCAPDTIAHAHASHIAACHTALTTRTAVSVAARRTHQQHQCAMLQAARH